MRLPPSPADERLPAFWAAYLDDPAGALGALRDELGPISRVPTPGGRHATILVGAEALEHVLAREHRKFSLAGAFTYLEEVAPRCIVAHDGERAVRVRQLLTSALRKDRIDRYVPDMVATTESALDGWPLDTAFELAAAMRELTLSVAARAFLYVDVSPALARALNVTGEYASPGPRSEKQARRPAFLEAKAFLDEFFGRVIAERRAGGIDRGDVVSALVLEGGMDDDELRDNLWGLLYASHDTTAHALAWAIYLLAGDRAALEGVLAELARVLGDRPPTVETLAQLEYLDAVVNETLRLYPSSPAIPRVAREAVELGGYTIPAGDLVVCHILLTQRSPDVFQRPGDFIPERWSGPPPPRGGYAPFGMGPRWCLGMPFALLEMKEVLAVAFRRFTFSLEPGQSILAYAGSPTMHPKPGILVRVARRAAPTPRG